MESNKILEENLLEFVKDLELAFIFQQGDHKHPARATKTKVYSCARMAKSNCSKSNRKSAERYENVSSHCLPEDKPNMTL